jgi:epoxyqueuosine reductase
MDFKEDNMLNSEKVKEIARSLGADLCGIAPVERFGNAPQGYHPLDVMPSCRSVIVIACRFNASTLTASSPSPYTVTRNFCAAKMNHMSVMLADALEAEGAPTLPIGSNYPDDFDARTGRYRGTISHKHAAELAGLGKIGKNTLLVNNQYGNMLWLSSVLTEAELTPDPLADYTACIPSCRLCLDICPVSALDGTTIDQIACRSHAFGERDGGEWRILCYECRKVCPNRLGIKL